MLNEITKKLIKTLLITFFISSFYMTNIYAEDNSARDVLDKFFSEPFEDYGDEKGKCEVRCRYLMEEPNRRFVTKIVDFDGTTGVTSCDVIPRNMDYSEEAKINVMANYKDKDCVNEYEKFKPNYESPQLASFTNKDKKNEELITLGKVDGENGENGTYDRSRVTLSKFIAGVATLDQDIINLKDSVGTGSVIRAKEAEQNTYILGTKPEDTTTVDEDNQTQSPSSEVVDPKSQRLYNVSDKLSKENLGYYIDLTYNMDRINDYINSYVFVFLALFFMLLYFTKIAIKKISKKSTAYDESWQNKLAVIVVATIIFFIPIKDSENKNYSETFFQNTWKFFVDESTSIADRANIVGMRTLMKNVYATTGVAGVESEANLIVLRDKQKYLAEVAYAPLIEQCKDKYPRETTYQETNPNYVEKISEQASRVGADESDLIYRGCRAIEKRHKIAITALEQLDYMLSRIQAAYGAKDGEGSLISNRLKEIDTFMSAKVQELGWLSVVMAPTLKVQVKNAYIQADSTVPKPVDASEEEKMNGFKAKIQEASSKKIAIVGKDEEGGNSFTDKFTSNTGYQRDVGKVFGFFAHNLMPGFDSIHSFVKERLNDKAVAALINTIPSNKNTFNIKSGENIGNFGSLVLTILIEQYVMENVPYVVAFIATSIIIILYFYELIVFTFVSPFIVAFALTTGQARKILDFLVTALTLFLKPILITISVFLALFLYELFSNIFMALADEQFYLSSMTSDSFWSALTVTFIAELFRVFATFASIFLLWKIIMHMSDFIFKLVGLDKLNGTSEFAQNMHQAMARSFKA